MINDNAPAVTGACQCLETLLNCECHNTIDTTKNQISTPHMMSTLRDHIRCYVDDLQPYSFETGSKVVSAMVDCCNFLLIESERLEKEGR